MKSSSSISEDPALRDVKEDEGGEDILVRHVSSSKTVCQSYQETYRIYHDTQEVPKDGRCQKLVPQEPEASGNMTTTRCGQDENYFVRIKQLQTYLDKVESLAKPGCSPEVLDAALGSISVLVDFLSRLSSRSRLQASLELQGKLCWSCYSELKGQLCCPRPASAPPGCVGCLPLPCAPSLRLSGRASPSLPRLPWPTSPRVLFQLSPLLYLSQPLCIQKIRVVRLTGRTKSHLTM